MQEEVVEVEEVEEEEEEVGVTRDSAVTALAVTRIVPIQHIMVINRDVTTIVAVVALCALKLLPGS